jgi:hypothetical protein
MKTRPRLNALEMYSTGYDSKNGIPNKTYRQEMQNISINSVIPQIQLTSYSLVVRIKKTFNYFPMLI